MLRHVLAAAAIAVACVAAPGAAPDRQAAAAQAAPAIKSNDYSDPATWLCRPGRQDACAVDLTTTVIAADGATTRESWAADPNAPIDCFYVYPTVSAEPTPVADMTAGVTERAVVRAQFARFASVCRPYAPLYRQVTLAGLGRLMADGGAEAGMMRGTGYNDVRDAWNYYLEHDNHGRRVVLIGHSQGSFVLMQLIRSEIDGKPVQSRLVSAILAGATLPVPRGKDVGGAFQHLPLCRSASQTGCVVVYSSFRSTSPPPADSLFGRVAQPGLEAACVNPAAPGGGSGELHSYFSSTLRTSTGATYQWLKTDQRIDTPFVSVPGMLTARCATNANANYLEITVHADPSGPRALDIPGDIVALGLSAAAWGLHQIDVPLAQGNLIDLVRAQRRALGSDLVLQHLP